MRQRGKPPLAKLVTARHDCHRPGNCRCELSLTSFCFPEELVMLPQQKVSSLIIRDDHGLALQRDGASRKLKRIACNLRLPFPTTLASFTSTSTLLASVLHRTKPLQLQTNLAYGMRHTLGVYPLPRNKRIGFDLLRNLPIKRT